MSHHPQRAQLADCGVQQWRSDLGGDRLEACDQPLAQPGCRNERFRWGRLGIDGRNDTFLLDPGLCIGLAVEQRVELVEGHRDEGGCDAGHLLAVRADQPDMQVRIMQPRLLADDAKYFVDESLDAARS